MTHPQPETPAPLPPQPERNKMFLLRVAAQLFSFAILAIVLSFVVSLASLFAQGPSTEEKTFVVLHGETAASIGTHLADEKLVYAAFPFRIAARIVGSLKAGEYAIPAKASPFKIATVLHEGKSIVRMFTAVEGLTSAEIVVALNENPALTGAIDRIPDEGALLPETYRYTYGDSRMSMISRMQKAMQEKISALWNTRKEGLPLASPQEAIVLASIIEKETGKTEERPRIAGVFYNRLRQNMRLQSDPTVIYALTNGMRPLNRALTHDDLLVASPINTYLRDGLPPQPICNPGSAAIEAALRPERHSFLYFVADGMNGHAFSSDLATHNKNVNNWHKAQENNAHP